METRKMTVEFEIDEEFRTLVAKYLEEDGKGEVTGEPANDAECEIFIETLVLDKIQEMQWEKVFKTGKCDRCGKNVDIKENRFTCPACKGWGFRC